MTATATRLTSLAIAALLVATVLVGAAALTGGAAAQATNNSTGTATLSFEDQVLTDDAVVIKEATLSAGGFVVVHDESNAVVGVSEYLDPGAHENVTVELEQSPENRQVFVAVAHTDDGTETFNASADPVYTENNQTVSATAFIYLEEPTRDAETTTGSATAETTTEVVTTERDAAAGTTATVTNQSDSVTEETTDTEAPGFGVAVAVVALLAAGLLAVRER